MSIPTPDQEAAAAVAAFEKLRPRMLALRPDQLLPPRPDARPLVAAARALAQEASTPALRTRLAHLPKDEFDQSQVDELSSAAAALTHARGLLDAALAPPADPQLSAELAERSGVLKERMLRVARYHFEDDTVLGKTLAALQRKRTSHGELAADLRRLSVIYREREAQLALDSRHYRATDANDAEKTAAEISAQLSAVNGEAIHAATESAARAQALLVAFYDEVRAALLFLLRKEAGVAERFPSLSSLPQPRGRPKKSDAPAEE